MTASASSLRRSASAAIKSTIDYPVIDTDVHTNDYAPAVEEYVAQYGGNQLVDEPRKAAVDRIERGNYGNGKSWYEQTPAGRQYFRSIRSPWWARVTKNTLDVAEELEDFTAAGIESVEDIKKRWVDSFFFGSESDDRSVAHAFNDKANPLGIEINAIYSSDVGHWDWVFGNPYKFYTEANPNFFKGTAIERKLASRSGPEAAAAE
ncbi:MAG TPA: hypothetical protein VG963_06100 [Polyangiaceae bacterium]|nr:hypothetical protein [Polyangiaceae bacterium]